MTSSVISRRDFIPVLDCATDLTTHTEEVSDLVPDYSVLVTAFGMVGYGDLVRPFTSMQIIVVSLPTLGQDRKVLCGMWLLASSVRLEQHLPISGRSG